MHLRAPFLPGRKRRPDTYEKDGLSDRGAPTLPRCDLECKLRFWIGLGPRPNGRRFRSLRRCSRFVRRTQQDLEIRVTCEVANRLNDFGPVIYSTIVFLK